jgi:hypothetical protein
MEPKLYIIMREDLPDMNPGKAVAQGCHAQADFDAYTENNYVDSDFREPHLQWCEHRNFGVTLVLSATKDQILQITQRIKHSAVTVDPTYPWRNWYGKLFTSSEITCAWAFVYEPSDLDFMMQFELHQ